MIPKVVLEILDESTGCLSDPQTYHYVVLAYWMATGACRRHNFDRDYYFCSSEARSKWWGGKNKQRKVLNSMNAQMEWLEIKDVTSGEGRQVLFKLTANGEGAILNALDQARGIESEWLDNEGKLINRRKPVIRSKDQTGGNAIRPKKYGIDWLCKVNTDALRVAETIIDKQLGLSPKELPECTEDLYVPIQNLWQKQKHTRDFAVNCKQQINSILVASSNPRFGMGVYPQTYVQSRAGRLYCESGTGLQNHRRFVREVALWGNYKYDIANAQLALLLQLAGETIESKLELGLYLSTKEYTRKLFGEIAGLTTDEVKQAVIALAFGSNPTSYKMQDILNSKNKEFFDLVATKRLAKEIREIRSTAVAKAPKSKRGVLNCLGRVISHNATESQKAAHLAQGAEAACLLAVMESPWADELTMLLHDGWYSAKPMPVDLLEQWIKDKTYLDVQIESK